eukprot:maker-scaffold256_size235750-snap-gene-0.11 protein:Tk08126 transcript:maker-scaffold256_size235750-snap-gene-0.11-mRNA-1 annotation:"lymphokine-activated killer t-cell-originated protein kinase-like"
MSKVDRDGFQTPICKRTRSRTSSAMEATPTPLGMLTPRVLRKNLLEIPPSPCLERLGYGTGVKVLLYERSPKPGGQAQSPWAIKKITKRAGREPEPDVVERIEKEAEILKALDHPNIIGFRGFKRDPNGICTLAIEKGDMSLMDIIEELREEEVENMEVLGPIQAKNIIKVVESVANALDYLHNDKHLLHGDLKAANILIRGNFDEVKLCDFGVTLELNKNLVKKNKDEFYIGTQPWSAKEAIDEGEITHKTDIFALGCVIYEMMALETPHVNKISTESEFSKLGESSDDIFDTYEYDDSEYEAALGTRPELPRDLSKLTDPGFDKILSLFFACTEEDPDRRPDAKTILDILREDLDNDKENRNCQSLRGNVFNLCQMPKETNPSALSAEFGGSQVWTYNATTKALFCQLCMISIDIKKKSSKKQHVSTEKQKRGIERETKAGSIGDCKSDQFFITAPGNFAPPVICGFNSGQHMSLPLLRVLTSFNTEKHLSTSQETIGQFPMLAEELGSLVVLL